MAPPALLTLGLALTACAGFIDAIGFIELGGYYTSFMSGNTTQAGVAIPGGGDLLLPLGLAATFFVGSFFGALLAWGSLRRGPELALGLTIVSLGGALIVILATGETWRGMLLLAAGAGAQNAVLPFSGGARLGTTFVTGTLFGAGQDLAGALLGRVPRWRWAQHLAVWLALLGGAALGAAAHAALGSPALLIPEAIYVFVLAAMILVPRQRPRDEPGA